MTQRLCRSCKKWHDLSESWPDECAAHFRDHGASGMQIIKDIEPYRSIITKEVIGGRKQHRDHLKAHGCIEIGNEKVTPRTSAAPSGLRADLRRTAERMFG